MRKSKRTTKKSKRDEIAIGVDLPMPSFEAGGVSSITNIGPGGDTVFLVSTPRSANYASGIYPSQPSTPQVFPSRYSTGFQFSGTSGWTDWQDYFKINAHSWEDSLQGMVELLNDELELPHDSKRCLHCRLGELYRTRKIVLCETGYPSSARETLLAEIEREIADIRVILADKYVLQTPRPYLSIF